jgi:hypothetical protein
VDSKDNLPYTRGLKARLIQVERKEIKHKPEGENYGIPFPSNAYIMQVQDKINDGYILILDDDDMYVAPNAVSLIMENTEPEKLLIWKTNFINRHIPLESFGKEVKLFDLPSTSICYHIKHKDKTDWTPWKRADYRTAKKLSEYMPIKWLDVVLTSLQSRPGMGKKNDLIINRSMEKTVRLLSNGKVKRLPIKLAAKVVADGVAEYVKDFVDSINKPVEPKGKPIVTENKALNVQLENKEDGIATTAPVNKRRQPAKPRSSKKVRSAK